MDLGTWRKRMGRPPWPPMSKTISKYTFHEGYLLYYRTLYSVTLNAFRAVCYASSTCVMQRGRSSCPTLLLCVFERQQPSSIRTRFRPSNKSLERNHKFSVLVSTSTSFISRRQTDLNDSPHRMFLIFTRECDIFRHRARVKLYQP